MDEFILETKNLTREFKGFVAVDDVNLRVKRGTIHALIGPNGAGKTTVFNLLTKFLPVTRGQIFYKGRDITAMQAAQVARDGLVRSFQISAVFSPFNGVGKRSRGSAAQLGHEFSLLAFRGLAASPQ